jgi:DNA-binding transcriptional LysR family regulator
MSRALGRLREALGDPLLVRAGRGLVLTPQAAALRARVHAAAAEASAVLGPAEGAPLTSLARTLVIRTNDAVAAVLVAPLHEATQKEAPGIQIRFIPEGAEDAAPLRDGRVDLDLGVIDLEEPELRRQRFFQDTFVGVVRRSHPLGRGRVSPARFVAHPHVAVSRQGRPQGPIDAGLAGLGLRRVIAAIVPDLLSALFAVASSDLITAVPGVLARHASQTLPLRVFPLPVPTPPIAISGAWHPRVDGDPAHLWLRRHVRALLTRHATRAARDAPTGGATDLS